MTLFRDRDALRRHISAHKVEGTPSERRAQFGTLTQPAQVRGEPLSIGHFDGLRFGARSDTCPILHFHGGGHVFGSPASHSGLASALAECTGRDVLLPQLPLAPDADWTEISGAALDLLGMLAHDHQCVVLSGDSAGGHLALWAALKAPGDVAAVIALSPNISRQPDQFPSRTENTERDAMNTDDVDKALAEMVFGKIEPDNPDQTLLKNDLTNLPPVFISVGQDEILRDEGIAFAKKAPHAHLYRRDGFHMEEVFAPAFPPGSDSLAAAGAWLSDY